MSLPKTLPFRRPLNIAGPLPHPIKSVPVLDPTINLSLPSRIAIIGNYLPRQCGIATFTTDLIGCGSGPAMFNGLLKGSVLGNDMGFLSARGAVRLASADPRGLPR